MPVMSVRAEMNRVLVRAIAAVVLLGVSAGSAHALPWDYDMYRQPSLQSGEVARSPVKGTVPLGYQPLGETLEEVEKKLTSNPMRMDRNSVWRGQRLWNANCLTCHGVTGDGTGPVGPQVGAPTLLNDFYKGKTDGRIYAVIHFGLRNMPRYGFKFSPAEHWDLVNYLRYLQGADVQGMQRPGK